jgi:hypothetical protein
MPSGTECSRYTSSPDQDGVVQDYIELRVDGTLEYGIDYAFQFAVKNPHDTPPLRLNTLRFETLVGGVILHLYRDIPAFQLERLHTFNVIPDETVICRGQMGEQKATGEPLVCPTVSQGGKKMSKLTFEIESDKAIPGASVIEIVAPRGFIFTCAFFRTEVLSPTTTCYTKANIARFTVDSQDPKPPSTLMRIIAFVTNPEYTPQPNTWAATIVSPLEAHIDTTEGVLGFDITGQMKVNVMESFPYKGERNHLMIEFVPSTILNQADDGNQIIISAPLGFEFDKNCSNFHLRWTDPMMLNLADDPDLPARLYPNVEQYAFPPPMHTCMGGEGVEDYFGQSGGVLGKNTLIVKLGAGAGMLARPGENSPFNYTIEVDVNNPKVDINVSNMWQVLSVVELSPEAKEYAGLGDDHHGMRMVDANLEVMGFYLKALDQVPDDVSWALRFATISLLALLW